MFLPSRLLTRTGIIAVVKTQTIVSINRQWGVKQGLLGLICEGLTQNDERKLILEAEKYSNEHHRS